MMKHIRIKHERVWSFKISGDGTWFPKSWWSIPLPLDKKEIDGFVHSGLKEESFLAYDDEQTPSVPHFFSTYVKYN